MSKKNNDGIDKEVLEDDKTTKVSKATKGDTSVNADATLDNAEESNTDCQTPAATSNYNQAPVASPVYNQVPQVPVNMPGYNQNYQPAPGAPAYNQGYQVPVNTTGYNQNYQPAPGAPAYNQGYQVPVNTPSYNQAQTSTPVYNQTPASNSAENKKDNFLFKTIMIILSVFLGIAILGFAGCASCAMFIGQVGDFSIRGPETEVPESSLPPIPFGGDGYKEAVPGNSKESLSLEDLLEYSSQFDNMTLNGKTSAGGYYIGKPSDEATPSLGAGEYFFEGSNDRENTLQVFSKDPSSDNFNLAYSMSFYGNYMASLKDNEFIIYEPSNSISTMYALKDEPFETSEPYPSGLYRVGVDIEAGTYSIIGNEKLQNNGMPMGAYVYSSLDFANPKTTISEHELSNVAQEITVQDGQYLEIYKGTATKL